MKAPLTMPVGGASQQQFELQRIDYTAPEASGRIGGVQAGFPLWSATWSLTNMRQEKSDEWRAFVSQLRGATRRFLGYDRTRQYPRAYTSFSGMTRAVGGAPFDGTATSWSESINADSDSRITLNGLPANFVMNQGDYIGFRWTATDDEVVGLTWHALVRAVEAKTGSSGGVITNMTCEPPVPASVPNDAVAYLERPSVVMTMITDQSNLEPVNRRGAIMGGTIVGIQDIRG